MFLEKNMNDMVLMILALHCFEMIFMISSLGITRSFTRDHRVISYGSQVDNDDNFMMMIVVTLTMMMVMMMVCAVVHAPPNWTKA